MLIDFLLLLQINDEKRTHARQTAQSINESFLSNTDFVLPKSFYANLSNVNR